MIQKKKDQPITQAYLDRALKKNSEIFKAQIDEAMGKQGETILEAMGYVFQEFKRGNDRGMKEFGEKVNKTYNLIDKYVKSQEDFKEEFEIMKYRSGNVEKVILDKLGVEIG